VPSCTRRNRSRAPARDAWTADAQAASLTLAPYAASEAESRGRSHPEPVHRYRGEFQRDRDRILHSSAFRRLVYKTQVFVNHDGDLYRTRLTHSLEVAQIARTVAASLGLNGHLTEAICLAHDLGHTPFGHSGQDALNACMKPWGGFEHNLQSLRVVEQLEERYVAFPGLNLTFETREGILKHCPPSEAKALGALGERFIARRQPGLEAQLANLADEIAYNNHDVDDGLRAGLLTAGELSSVRIFRRHFGAVSRSAGRTARRRPGAMPRKPARTATSHERSRTVSPRVLVHETVRRMIDEIVTDLIVTTRANLDAASPASIEDVRGLQRPLVALGKALGAEHRELKAFLHRSLYRHERVLDMNRRARQVVTALFERFLDDPRAMPAEHAARAHAEQRRAGDAGRARAVADYLAGMTDRYAVATYRRLVDATLRW